MKLNKTVLRELQSKREVRIERRVFLRTVLAIAFAVILVQTVCGCSSSPSVDPREQMLDAYVRQQIDDYGYLEGEITYEDNGEGNTVFIEFRPEDFPSQELIGYDDAMAQDEADELAEELSSIVYILGYTSDNRLVSAVVAEPPNFNELDESVKEDAVDQFMDVQNEYVEFARENAEAWLSEYVSNALGYFEGLDDIQYVYDEENSGYFIAFMWSDGYSPVEGDSQATAAWQEEVNFISKATGYNIALAHGYAGGGMQLLVVGNYADNMLYGYYPTQQAESAN